MPISRAWPTPSATAPNVRPSNRSGACTVWPPTRSRSAKAVTPGVSPWAWWNRTISAIGSARALGRGVQRPDEQDLLGRAAQPGAQPLDVAAPAVPVLAQAHLAGARLRPLGGGQSASLGAGGLGQARAHEDQFAHVGEAG